MTSTIQKFNSKLLKRVSFEGWKAEVNALVAKHVGLDADSLPGDPPFSDWYEQGMRPETAANKAARMSRWYW